ncbi:MAG: DNA replication/repair protein RecF [Gammaproteobacteria bacterium]
MLLSRLKFQFFRNLFSIDMTPQRGVNLIIGPNATGKTSLLEAIYTLGHGRSFKEQRLDSLIQLDQSLFTVFAEIQKEGRMVTCGLMKAKDLPAQIQIGGDRTRLLSKLAETLPLLLISPESFKLLKEGPVERRKFLDWGVFHVEHSFGSVWQQYQKVLKQRNAELKQLVRSNALAAWDRRLAELGETIAEMREAYWKTFSLCCIAQINELLPLKGLTISLNAGWDRSQSLEKALAQTLVSDFKRGFTQVGPHRADIIVKQNGIDATDIFSRGQQKLLICAFYLAAGEFLKGRTSKACIYLIDDMAAELDAINQKRVLASLMKTSEQVFVTGLDEGELEDAAQGLEGCVFHVEQLNQKA